MAAEAAASPAAAAAGPTGSVSELIAQRERELAQLRADSVASLEQQVGRNCAQVYAKPACLSAVASTTPSPERPPASPAPSTSHTQVAAKDAALEELQARLAALQAEHGCTLAQLEERGGELAARSDELAAAAAELGATRDLLAQMQGALGEAEEGKPCKAWCGADSNAPFQCSCRCADVAQPAPCFPPTAHPAALSAEHATRTAVERQLVQQRRVLAQEAEAARAAGEAALRQQQHEASTRERRLEAELERAAAAAERHQREAAAAHQAELQRMQASMPVGGGEADANVA